MKNPFIVGSWVRGKKFFGRNRILMEILEGPRACFWVLGNRRTGKTSLLKQVEYLVSRDPLKKKVAALFWDLQGSEDEEGLRVSFHDALLDAEELLEETGLEAAAVQNLDFFQSLRVLKKACSERNRKLLLLCDEAEELITVARNSPKILPRLKKFLLSDESIKTVLVATKKLSVLAEPLADTSPFLYGFIPPLYLASLEEDAAWALISLAGFPYETAVEIQKLTNSHPFLTQLVCSRIFEGSTLVEVEMEIVNDEMISCFFVEDFQALDSPERAILRTLVAGEALTKEEIAKRTLQPPEKVSRMLYSLQSLGFVRKAGDLHSLANRLFAGWLSRKLLEPDSRRSAAPQAAASFGSILEARTGEYVFSFEAFAPGASISHYTIEELLGSGGMGVVYRATDTLLGRAVVLKFFRPGLLAEDEMKRRFKREAVSASRLNHPGIVTIYEIAEWQGIVFIAMEYIEGTDLRRRFRNGPPEVNEAMQVMLEISGALGAAHDMGIVHLDLKPENVLVRTAGGIKIVDFGCARFLEPQEPPGRALEEGGRGLKARISSVLGTPLYMAPEQIRGAGLDCRADIYSFGVLAYELLTGAPPFAGNDTFSLIHSILTETPRAPSSLNRSVPLSLDRTILKALEKDPTERFSSMAELERSLRKHGKKATQNV